MPRLKQAGREAANEYATRIFNIVFGDRDPVAEPGTATGTPGNWWTVFNILPDAFEHTTEGFRFYRSPKRLIDPKLRAISAEYEEQQAAYVKELEQRLRWQDAGGAGS